MSRASQLPGLVLLVALALAASACGPQYDEPVQGGSEQSDQPDRPGQLSLADKLVRYAAIRNAASSLDVHSAYLLAGISNTESKLAHCWSEATSSCKGPNSPDCGGGPVMAGSGDGPCELQEGGLGLFQFDAGTYADTLNEYGQSVLSVDGQTGFAIDYVATLVENSVYIADADSHQAALAWINNFDSSNEALLEAWLNTLLQYHDDCQPDSDCWQPRYQNYKDGLWAAIDEPGGMSFWHNTSDLPCGALPDGPIKEKYLALGGCDSVLGAVNGELSETPDGVGQYAQFVKGSIYWTAPIGAFEVHGNIWNKWSALGREAGLLGYPITDELATSDGVGRKSVFAGGSVYWSPQTNAHEVHGLIGDRYRDLGSEASSLGYPTSDEYAVTEGRRSDFQGGALVWNATTGVVSEVP